MIDQHILLAFSLVSEKDSIGIYGTIFHYAMIFAFVGSALLAFIYFWKKGRLDMDELPKYEMMHHEDEGE